MMADCIRREYDRVHGKTEYFIACQQDALKMQNMIVGLPKELATCNVIAPSVKPEPVPELHQPSKARQKELLAELAEKVKAKAKRMKLSPTTETTSSQIEALQASVEALSQQLSSQSVHQVPAATVAAQPEPPTAPDNSSTEMVKALTVLSKSVAKLHKRGGRSHKGEEWSDESDDNEQD